MRYIENLLDFDMDGMPFSVGHADNVIFVYASSNPEIIPVCLPINAPGPYDISTPTSTYDVRGERSLKISLIEKKPGTAVIKVDEHDSSEDWRWGSDDDDWHSLPERDTIYMITASLNKMRFTCKVR